MASQRFFHLVLKLYARKIIQTAYTGILGREPDDRGLASYAQEFATTGDLSLILGDFARSSEAWESNFYLYPSALIRLIYKGLLEREPNSQEVDEGADLLSQTKDLSGVISALAQSQEHWEKQVSHRAEELIEAAFQGLLERTPDSKALHAYKGQLAQTKDLTKVLSAITQSQEHWEKQVSHRAEELIEAAFQGLLERTPDSEALHAYKGQLAQTKDLTKVLSAITQSQEHWEKLLEQKANDIVKAVSQGLGCVELEYAAISKYAASLKKHRDLSKVVSEIIASEYCHDSQLRQQAPKLVEGIYQGLLNRHPDEKGLLAYTKLISEASDIELIITKVCESAEYRTKVRSNLADNEESISARVLTLDRIERIYLRYREQKASNDELAAHLIRQDTISQVLSKQIAKTSKTNRPPRVLLFGAFGNGNMGDVYQAMAVRAHLKKCWGLTDDYIFSCSLLNSSTYPFPPNNKFNANSIFDYELINSFDCLIIGGGGLLAHPHAPLFDSVWARRVEVPIVLLSVGASSSNLNQHASLLENALFVSGRDSESLNALKTHRVDASLILDPILSVKDIQSLTEFDLPPKFSLPDFDVLWILKYPSNDFDTKILHWIASYIRGDSSRKHLVVAIEPKLDIFLKDYFPDQSVLYFYELAELNAYIEKAQFIFSMRYHGAIFSIMANKPTFGFSQKKIKALFGEFGLFGEYLENISDFERLLPNLDAFKNVKVENHNLCKVRFSKEFKEITSIFFEK